MLMIKVRSGISIKSCSLLRNKAPAGRAINPGNVSVKRKQSEVAQAPFSLKVRWKVVSTVRFSPQRSPFEALVGREVATVVSILLYWPKRLVRNLLCQCCGKRKSSLFSCF